MKIRGDDTRRESLELLKREDDIRKERPQMEKMETWLLMGIMWPESQSHFHLLFIFIEMNFYSLSFLCDVCNEVHEYMQ